MALQPNSYKKFVTSAATAALVASALIPAASAAETKSFTDVSSNYKDAVDYLLANKITSGISDTKFGTDLSIKRGDAAIFIAKALGLDTVNAPSADFTDVNSRVEGAVNAIVEAKIASGKTESTFAPDDNITRAEMAKLLVNAYKLQAGDTKNTFSDVNSTWDGYVDALLASGVTLGLTETTFGATQNVTRGQFALFIHRAEVPFAAGVASVSAANPTTLTITGTALNSLKAADVTVEGNTVKEVKVSEDGKTATVTLEDALEDSKEVKVTVKVNEQSKEFTVKYTLAVDTVTVDSVTFDDDAKNQKVTFKINGQSVDLDYLAANGYTVEFLSLDKDGKSAVETFFKTETSKSEDGKLADLVTIGEYQIQVTVSKNGTVLNSEKTTVQVKNLDSAGSSISAYELTNNDLEAVQNSTTLVAGETAEFTELTVAAGSAKNEVASGIKVKSDNEGVLSVTDADGVYTLHAEAPGTAKITVSYGGLEKVITFTVANKEREVAKVTPEKSSVTVISGVATEVEVKVTDQYGDPFNSNTDDIEEILPSNKDDLFAAGYNFDIDSDEKGKQKLSVTGKDAGTGTINFRDEDGKALGSLKVTVSKVNNLSKKVIEVIDVTDQSKDNNLDATDAKDNKVTYKLAKYTTQNVYAGTQDLTGYTAKFDKKIVTVNADTDGEAVLDGTDFDVVAVDKGTTDIAIYDAEGVFAAKVTVKVTNDVSEIKSVDWKKPGTINYIGEVINFKDVLDTVSSANDDIVKNITLTSSTVHKVRIVDADTDTEGTLYIDKNDDGVYDDGSDTYLGTLTGKLSASEEINDDFAGITAGVTTAQDDKGTVIFSIIDEKDNDKVIVSTSVTVDVK